MAKSKRELERKQAREGGASASRAPNFWKQEKRALTSETPAAAHGPPPRPAGKRRRTSVVPSSVADSTSSTKEEQLPWTSYSSSRSGHQRTSTVSMFPRLLVA